MDKFRRILSLHQIFSHRRYPVSSKILTEELRCSVPTIKRAISTMRSWLNAPIVYDRKARGYQYAQGEGMPQFDLPGLWFNSDEIFAILSLEQLLSSIEPGFLSQALSPARKRLSKLLKNAGPGQFDPKRLKVLGIGQRRHHPQSFQRVAAALFECRQLEISYHARTSNQHTQRTISPQRLIHYRYNWYLDAWCHTRKALRVFALERVRVKQTRKEKAIQIDVDDLEQQLSHSYGIFSGIPKFEAVLQFSAERARWVADEYWHPEQRLVSLGGRGCQLSFPYADDRELIQDILKHGHHVEVISPPELRQSVAREIDLAREIYQKQQN